jgi:hypothetical protein
VSVLSPCLPDNQPVAAAAAAGGVVVTG